MPADLRRRGGKVRPLAARHGRCATRRLAVHADRRHAQGNRPSFSDAARPETAESIYDCFCSALRALGVAVDQGIFGARMAVELVNDGPVTIVLDVE
jgi:D-tyrosyl-tRNA(Tyr) deacylase